MHKIMVKNINEPGSKYCDIRELARIFGSDFILYSKIRQSILNHKNLDMTHEGYRVIVDRNDHLIELRAKDLAISFKYKVWNL